MRNRDSYPENRSSTPLPPTRVRLKWFNGTKGFGFVVPEGSESDAFLHVTTLQNVGVTAIGEGAEMVCEVEYGPKGAVVRSILEVLSTGDESNMTSLAGAGGSDFGGRPPRSGGDRFGDRSGGGRYGERSGGRERGGFGDRDRGGYGDRDRGGYGSRDRGGYGDRDSGPQETLTGTVKWFKGDKGFGFVVPDDGQKDIFIHKSCLERSGVRGDLNEGQRVRMSVRSVSKGREAVDVEVLD